MGQGVVPTHREKLWKSTKHAVDAPASFTIAIVIQTIWGKVGRIDSHRLPKTENRRYKLQSPFSPPFLASS
jgi:hypothetical protein